MGQDVILRLGIFRGRPRTFASEGVTRVSEYDAAFELAEEALAAELPRRWAHSQGVAECAVELAPLLTDRAHVLAASAILHDIGYSSRARVTGFHPLDGARYLRDVGGFDDVVTRLVAHHSMAIIEADLRGLSEELVREFPVPGDALLTDALIFCDMTTTPDGARTTSSSRIEEIASRYGADSIVGRFIGLAEPHIHAAVRRVEDAKAGIRSR